MDYEDQDIGTRYYGTDIDDPLIYGYGASGYGFEGDSSYDNESVFDPTYGGDLDLVSPDFDIDAWWGSQTDEDKSVLDKIASEGGSDIINKAVGFLGDKAGDFLKKYLYDTATGKVNLAGMGTAAAALAMLAGKNKVETGGYNKPVPKFDVVREQVQYNDPNRRPGEAGRQYFTDTRFTPQGDTAALDAAKAASAEQASGILAAYQPRAAEAPNPYAGKMNLAYSKPTAAPAPTQPAALPQIPTQLNAQGGIGMAQGGIADAGRYLRGKTDGMADEIETSIDEEQPALLSHGEFVIPADVVSHLGNGNSEAGAEKLYEMMDRIRMARTGTKEQGKEIDPDKFIAAAGGLAAYAGGGEVKKFAEAGLVPAPTTTTSTPAATGSTSGVTGFGTSSSSQLSPWAGEYVTNYLGQGAALAQQPYQAYQGPLTAGASDLQQQAFAGMSEVAQAGYTPGQFAGGFGAQQAQQYMNPYLQASLDPQLRELQRASDIARLADAGRLTKAGAFGGSRQAIMESEGRRNLLDKQQDVLGQGYKTAYDLGLGQFNKEREADEASRQFGANFGLKSIDQLSGLGATQRGITSEGIAADKAQFEEQRDFAYKMPQYQKDLLQGIPVTTTATTANTTELGRIGGQISDLQGLYDKLSKLGQTPT